MSITLNQEAPAAAAVKADNADGHFYGFTEARGWFPLYKDDGEFRMAEARKLHAAGEIAMPSATGYIDGMRKYMIEEYDKKNVAKACYAMEKAGLDLETWTERALSIGSTASHAARDKGSAIHKAFELCAGGHDYAAEYDLYVQALNKEIVAHGLDGFSSEECVGSLKYGVGGKCDINHAATMTISDIKTRGHKVNKVKVSRVPTYEADKIQTAIYGYCKFGNAFFISGRGIIFATSTVIPGLVTTHVFTGPELVEAFETFLALTTIWRFTHNCDPRRPLYLEERK